jgi:hypothetical protein
MSGCDPVIGLSTLLRAVGFIGVAFGIVTALFSFAPLCSRPRVLDIRDLFERVGPSLFLRDRHSVKLRHNPKEGRLFLTTIPTWLTIDDTFCQEMAFEGQVTNRMPVNRIYG